MSFKPPDYWKALLRADMLRRFRPCKQWRGTGYYDVPAFVLRQLVDDGKMDSKKDGPSDPTLWRPK